MHNEPLLSDHLSSCLCMPGCVCPLFVQRACVCVHLSLKHRGEIDASSVLQSSQQQLSPKATFSSLLRFCCRYPWPDPAIMCGFDYKTPDPEEIPAAQMFRLVQCQVHQPAAEVQCTVTAHSLWVKVTMPKATLVYMSDYIYQRMSKSASRGKSNDHLVPRTFK